jgi:hypothetical protein
VRYQISTCLMASAMAGLAVLSACTGTTTPTNVPTPAPAPTVRPAPTPIPTAAPTPAPRATPIPLGDFGAIGNIPVPSGPNGIGTDPRNWGPWQRMNGAPGLALRANCTDRGSYALYAYEWLNTYYRPIEVCWSFAEDDMNRNTYAMTLASNRSDWGWTTSTRFRCGSSVPYTVHLVVANDPAYPGGCNWRN